MLKVLVDFYRLKEVNSGLGYFSNQLGRSLLSNQTDSLDVTFMLPRSAGFVLPPPAKIIFTSFFKMIFSRFNNEFDVWHATSQFPMVYPGPKTKFILTIHDLNFLIEKPKGKRSRYLKKMQNKLDRADVVTTISFYTKYIVEKNLSLNGKKIHVIYNGVESPESFPSCRPNWMPDKKFFFSVGYFTVKKNWQAIIDLMTEFDDYHLIISGYKDTKFGKYCENFITQKGLNDRVILSGVVSNEEKSWLYSNCSAFLFPSLAEGFGMPVVEAMKMGKPVFLSTYTSLPEIGGDVAFFFDNFEKDHMKQQIEKGLAAYLSDPKGYSKKIKEHAAKFDWNLAAKQYIELYKSLS